MGKYRALEGAVDNPMVRHASHGLENVEEQEVKFVQATADQMKGRKNLLLQQAGCKE